MKNEKPGIVLIVLARRTAIARENLFDSLVWWVVVVTKVTEGTDIKIKYLIFI